MRPELAQEIAAAQDDPEAEFGDYLLLNQIAVGTFGSVHRAWDLEAERLVAIKLLTKLNATLRQRFAREIKAGERLEHPNIVGVLDSGEHRRRPFLVMNLVEGESLKALAGTMKPERAVEILLDVANAISFAHGKGVLHRDLKPENVLVEGKQTRVVDFGLARFTQPEGPKLTGTGEMVGSPLFMAPEQSAGTFSESGDVYALGATLYYALTGKAPLEADTLDDYLDQLEREHPPPPSSRESEIPTELDTICLTCLEKSPENRYPSAAAFAADLQRWLAGEPIEAQPLGGVEGALRWAHRKRVGLVFALLALVAIVATIVLVSRS